MFQPCELMLLVDWLTTKEDLISGAAWEEIKVHNVSRYKSD